MESLLTLPLGDYRVVELTLRLTVSLIVILMCSSFFACEALRQLTFLSN